jgi:uncharacterized protein YdhG (YjbR/CyaY superfamily)
MARVSSMQAMGGNSSPQAGERDRPRLAGLANVAHMSAREIDDYLSAVDDPAKREALEVLRRQVLEAVPEAEQCISYSMPAFRVGGKVVAGFAAFKDHLSYLPHSSSVLTEMGDDLAPWTATKGSLHFTPEHPLPDRVVQRLVVVRRAELGV